MVERNRFPPDSPGFKTLLTYFDNLESKNTCTIVDSNNCNCYTIFYLCQICVVIKNWLVKVHSIRGAWIAQWYNTQHWTLECWALCCEFVPQWGQKLFQLEYNIYTQELSDKDKIFTIICKWFVNLCCLWKLEND